MLNIVYTVTPTLQETLSNIDTLRRHILTTPIAPRTELKLRFNALVEHIAASLSLADIHVSKQNIINLPATSPKHTFENQRDVAGYKQALDWIRENWAGNPKPLSASAIETLATLALSPASRATRDFGMVEPIVRQLLKYLESASDHPTIMGAIAHAQLLTTPIGSTDGGRVARLTDELVRAKFGYDIRGMLEVASVLSEAAESYRRAFDSITRLGQLTNWLEYCAKTTLVSLSELKDAVEAAAKGSVKSEIPASCWELNDRQKAILSLTENPTNKITNRDVQKRFKVSQITASRDLAKLTSLSLLYPHGKGRSVYYTRV